jgi:hypothetical protein
MADSMFVAEQAFVEAMRKFRLMRASLIEKEYYETHGDACNQRMRNELYDRILRLLGANKGLMIEFADRDAACYNPNTDYFYNRGFADCLAFLRTIEGVSGENLTLERVLLFGDRISYGGEWTKEQNGSGLSANH